MKKLEGEKASLGRQVKEAKEAYQNLSDAFRLMTGERDQVAGEMRKLEVSKIIMCMRERCCIVWIRICNYNAVGFERQSLLMD